MNREKDNVMEQLVQLIETAANGKKKILDFGNDMVFYRGEIHIIKMIGDQPGMYVSEIAKKLNVTRAVISKSLKKLEARNFIKKEEGKKDKKKLAIYLTNKGKLAYKAHLEFHLNNDKAMFEYLDTLDNSELKVIKTFLQKARDMTKNHY